MRFGDFQNPYHMYICIYVKLPADHDLGDHPGGRGAGAHHYPLAHPEWSLRGDPVEVFKYALIHGHIHSTPLFPRHYT